MRIGVFGGTFDPIHRTHVDIGRAALKHKALDRVLFVVSADPPHKGDEITPADDRFAMVEAALASEPGLDPCDLELHREGPSYTADTMKALRALYPDAEFFLIIGQDALIDLPGWRSPQDILEEAQLLVLPRPSEARFILIVLDGHFEMLPFAESLMSSTEVRGRLAAGDAAADCLSPAVLKIARDRGLYHAHR